MKTIRTIIATLSGVLLTFALVAWFSVRRNAAFIQRTIYQGFDQTFVVALVMGCAFLLIAVILTVAIVSTDNDEDEEEDEEPIRQPRKRSQASAEQPYRRVSRARQAVEEEEAYLETRPKPAPKKRPAQSPESIPLRREETPMRSEKRPPKPQPAPEPKKRPAVKAPVWEEEEPLLPETEPEEAEEASEALELEEEAGAEPAKEEGTVRCVFCGAAIPRDSLFCPRCGKKR
jgi:hypothetical protein